MEAKYYYRLMLINKAPINAKPLHLKPQKEVWLDVHLYEIITKGVIGLVLLHKQSKCVLLLLLIYGV